MVLTCITEAETKIFIQERLGNESQRWLLDNNMIVSSTYAICAREGENSLVCIKKNKAHENDLCFLQPSVRCCYCINSCYKYVQTITIPHVPHDVHDSVSFVHLL